MRQRVNVVKQKTKKLTFRPDSCYFFIQQLILEGLFDCPVTTQEIIKKIKGRFGKRIQSNHIQTYMRKFMYEGIIYSFPHPNRKGNLWVLTNVSEEDAMHIVKGSRKGTQSLDSFLPVSLVRKMRSSFDIELNDLQHNFGTSGTCTAFLLRKILEKLFFLTFSKNGLHEKLKDPNGGFIGLETMIASASSEKISGLPFLMPKTAKYIGGIKFLGDAAAHNPLTNVDMKTIVPQIPYIITAYEELAQKL